MTRLAIASTILTAVLANPAFAADAWVPIPFVTPPPAGEIPYHRVEPTAIYDAAHRQMVVYGGQAENVLSDLNALTLDGNAFWNPVDPDGSSDPVPPRRDHVAIYDSQEQRMIVFGGCSTGANSPAFNDVWSLSLDAAHVWSHVEVANPVAGPSARFGMAAIYDPSQDRLVVFGGSPGLSGFLNETWALSLGATPTWTAVTSIGSVPSARNAMSAVYDPSLNRMLVFGGWNGSAYLNDVWALSLGGSPEWTPVTSVGPAPSARRHAALVFDPVRNRLIVTGGFNGTYLDDAWALDLSGTPTWSLIGTSSVDTPGPRSGHRAIYDAEGDRLVEFGGYGNPQGFTNWLSDTWALPLAPGGTWEELAASPNESVPAVRRDHVAVFDPDGDRMVVFGGLAPSGTTDDVWALGFSGTPEWTRLTPATGPSRRYVHAGAFDSARRRLLVFGGIDDVGYLNDVWALSLSDPPAWTNLTPSSGAAPERREGAAAAYDPVGDRLLVFGGELAFHQGQRADLWALPLGVPNAQWVQLSPTGAGPAARQNCAALYDATRQRLILEGGLGGGDLNDAWAVDFTAPGDGKWICLDAGSAYSPPARHGHAAILDGAGRFLLFGGMSVGEARNDSWAAGPAAFTFWEPILPSPLAERPSARERHSLVYDMARDRAILFGGSDYEGRRLADAWYLQHDSDVPVDVPRDPVGTVALALSRVTPNPVHGGAFDVTFALPRGGAGSIGLYDVRGRAVVTRNLTALTAGEHRIKLAPPAGTGAGVYFVALTQDGAVRRTKVILLD